MAQIEFPTNPYHGQIYRSPEIAASYIYDKTRDSWYFEPISGGGGSGAGGSSSVQISDLPPSTATNGDLWIEATTYYLYVFDETVANSGRWIGVTNNGGDNTTVHMGSVPPSGGVQEGQMWFDTEQGDLRVLYSDPLSSQWVTITSNGQSSGTASNLIKILEQEIDGLSAQIEALKEQIEGTQGLSIELE